MAREKKSRAASIELPENPVFIISSYGLEAAPEDGFILTEAEAVKVAMSSSFWSSGRQIIDDIWAIPLNQLVEISSAVKLYGKRPVSGKLISIWSRLDKPLTKAFIESHELKRKFEGSKRYGERAKIKAPTTLYLAQGSIPGKHWWSAKVRVIGVFASEEQAIRLTPAHFKIEEAIADGVNSYNRKTIRGRFGSGFGYAKGYGKTDPHYEAYEASKHLHDH